ncbi:MAG: alpha-ketoglutarate-dependent dioxygenase AlkB [Lewinella sp.]
MQLPLNCTASYHADFLSVAEAVTLYDYILHECGIDDFRITTHTADGPGLAAFGKLMFIDEDLHQSGRFPEAAYGKNFPWPPEILTLKNRVEAHTGLVFGTCVCIWYPDGNIGVDYHSDQPAFGDTTVLPSISLGAERNFQLRENATGKVFEKRLETGSMIIMGAHCQDRYEHCLPEDPACTEGRINITFRQVGFAK